MSAIKNYALAGCKTGCAFHTSEVNSECAMCRGPLAQAGIYTAEQARALIRNDAAYQVGKRQAVREMLTARYKGAIPVTDEMVDAVLAGV